ncbi:MAG: hypothetical protein ACYC91_18055 [Solirubrobacteraceae bacterium]
MSEQVPGRDMPDATEDDRGADGRVNPEDRIQAVVDQNEGDPHHPVPPSQPGAGGAPGGEPVGEDEEESAPPGTREGGAPDGPPAHHQQRPV